MSEQDHSNILLAHLRTEPVTHGVLSNLAAEARGHLSERAREDAHERFHGALILAAAIVEHALGPVTTEMIEEAARHYLEVKSRTTSRPPDTQQLEVREGESARTLARRAYDRVTLTQRDVLVISGVTRLLVRPGDSLPTIVERLEHPKR